MYLGKLTVQNMVGGRIMEETKEMRACLVFTAAGPFLALTTYNFVDHPEMLSKLAANAGNKFIAYEVPFAAVKTSYGDHVAHVLSNPAETGDIKVLDHDGKRIFTNIDFKELSAPIYFDKTQVRV
jgi:hypothetical protein